MSVEENNKALVRRFVEEVLNGGNLDAVDELMAPDYLDHTVPSGKYAGREGHKRSLAKQLAASSDLRFHIEEQIAEGEKVVTWVVGSGTHDQERFMGLAPTGERITIENIIISRVVEGKIVEDRGVRDASHVWQQRLQRERIERERVEQEMRLARSIQQASLPKEVPTLEGWQIAPFYQPAREVGGDFYDFLELTDGRLGLVVGDATGKGVPAALVMASTRSMLRAVAQASDYSPGDVLSRVNDSLVIDIPSNMFVTCFYAILDPNSGTLRYANAGHDLPYLRRRGGDAEELRARGMPLGLMPDMTYEEKQTILEAEEAALLYSDGLVEAHDPNGEMFGFPRLRALIAEHGEERSLGDFLMEDLYSFVGEGWEQEDDITLLTLRRSASLS
ncbi:MAG: SpoIIE family protein phosphatase [Actinomycetota bacterium]|nr:SpoIIE family protein phosphatase [Rubrobacteraceae bacterium]MDQ3437698.1 SpoIIE family protein phosphatase [Actinomycetota bacterium]